MGDLAPETGESTSARSKKKKEERKGKGRKKRARGDGKERIECGVGAGCGSGIQQVQLNNSRGPRMWTNVEDGMGAGLREAG